MEILDIKMISGEEIISMVTNSSDMTVTLSHPLSFVMSYNHDDKTRGDVVFAPWMIGKSMDTDIILSKSHIIAMCKPSDEAKKAYMDATGIAETPVIPVRAPRQISAQAVGSHRSAPSASA